MNDKFKLNFESDEDSFDEKQSYKSSTKPTFVDINDDDEEEDEDYYEKRKNISNKFNVFGDDNLTPKIVISQKTSQSAASLPTPPPPPTISFNDQKLATLSSSPITPVKINSKDTSSISKPDRFSTEIILSSYQNG